MIIYICLIVQSRKVGRVGRVGRVQRVILEEFSTLHSYISSYGLPSHLLRYLTGFI